MDLGDTFPQVAAREDRKHILDTRQTWIWQVHAYEVLVTDVRT